MTYVTGEMSLAKLLEAEPNIAKILFSYGADYIGQCVASGDSILGLAERCGADYDEMVMDINFYLASKNRVVI